MQSGNELNVTSLALSFLPILVNQIFQPTNSNSK